MNQKKNEFRRRILTKLLLPFAFLLFTCLSFAQTLAPGAPGKDANWATAGKQGVGTSASLESKVWFTLAQGVMTEVYYPDVTVANVHLLQFVVVGENGKVETEQNDSIHKIEVLTPENNPRSKDYHPQSSYALTFKQINSAKSGEWKITKTYITDPNSDVVLIDVKFEGKGHRLFIHYDPSLANSGMHDTAWTENGALLANDGNIFSALVFSHGNTQPNQLKETSNGFLGIRDGLTQMQNSKEKGFFRKPLSYEKAEKGNVVQFAKVPPEYNGATYEQALGYSLSSDYEFTLALAFGNDKQKTLNKARQSLFKGFEKTRYQYEQGWFNYLNTVKNVDKKYQAQFNMAAMQLKAHEDKANRGANIASLSVPWGGDKNANENTVGGYHLVWSRDLYQVATAFMALGDKAAAERALDFLFKVQQKPDGSFPQNSWLDGKPFWGSLQMDEVAFPLILAYQLGRNDKVTYENHVKKAADFIVKNGPTTPQERWEERSGYSPSTIAAEIAGLVCAAEIARKNSDETSANLYLKTADEWQANIEKWTATTNGKYGDGNYYLRITQKGNPNAGDKIDLGNGAGIFDEREIVDAGFLELVRLGVKSPDDPLIQKSVKVIDEVIRVKTPNGDAFYRYNHDGYGEMDDGRRWNWDGKYTGKGRLWALLSGERGQYELALYDTRRAKFYAENKSLPRSSTLTERSISKIRLNAQSRLDSMLAFANEGLMIPEQIWDKPEIPKNIDKQFIPELKFGEGTGSATPLAWSMAQFIRLAVNLQAGKNLDTPDVVYNRYVLKSSQSSVVSGQSEKNNDDIMEVPLSFQVGIQDVDKFFQNSDGSSKTAQAQKENSTITNQEKNIKSSKEKGLSLKYILRPKNQEFANFAINWNCEEKWAAKNPSFEIVAERVVKKGNIEFFQCSAEKTTAIIFYEGTAKNVEIVGDFSDWKPKQLKFFDYASESKKLKLIPIEFSSTARVEYKFIVDGKWITDPLNPNKIDNGIGGENSFFTMPDYKATVWDKRDEKGAYFQNFTTEIDSKIYGKRRVEVFAPFGTNFQELPVLYLLDGMDYIKRAEAIIQQQNLMNAGKIKPFIMVFLDAKDRNKEYWANDDYAKFVATEVVPVIDAKYKTIKTRDGRAIMGASLGGISSIHTVLKYPDIFGRVGGQSTSFWIDNERVVKDLEKLDGKTKFNFYFDDGTLEGVEDSRKVVEILRKKGFEVVYSEGEAGHNWTAWRDRFADALTAIWK